MRNGRPLTKVMAWLCFSRMSGPVPRRATQKRSMGENVDNRQPIARGTTAAVKGPRAKVGILVESSDHHECVLDMGEKEDSKDIRESRSPANQALIDTKLAVPMQHSCLVSRPYLVSRLEQLEAGHVALIIAPAGFGKTTLIAEWAGIHQDNIAWLSLDDGDNEPVRFWSYVVAALRSAKVDLNDRVDELLTSGDDRDWESIISLLLHDMIVCEHAFTLVLDDYQLVLDNVNHYYLGKLLRHQPRQMRLIIMSRADPPLALARLRVEGRLTELRAADLRFSFSEMVTFFNCALPYRLSQTMLEELYDRIEGWPAGLQLAALSMQELEQKEAAAFVRAFSGAERFVFHYLLEEVLQRQPPRIQTFLLHTSLMRNLNPQLCTAVTGFEDSARILEKMAEDNLFIKRLTGIANWYRYHRLFADALRNRLAQTEPELIPELRQRALDWYARQDSREDVPLHMLPAMLMERDTFGLDEEERLPTEPLTEREGEILVLIGRGLSNQEIADHLVLSVGTVKGHINHLLSKLNAHSRTEALVKARRLGIL